MRVGRRGRFVGLEMTRFQHTLRAVARFACIAALLCGCGFMPREKHAGQTQANELEGVYVVGTLYKRCLLYTSGNVSCPGCGMPAGGAVKGQWR